MRGGGEFCETLTLFHIIILRIFRILQAKLARRPTERYVSGAGRQGRMKHVEARAFRTLPYPREKPL